ncbi:MAG TPA: ABC transporter permease, partial [Bryobacteraceae bacterium]|nr:ABC transporter permease [Bryobacteraceae bacterium]
MLDALIQDLRYAFRALRSSPGFTAVAVLSLGLGIGANTAIFSLINVFLLKSLPVERPEELQQVLIGKNGSFTNPIWEELRNRQDIFSGVFAFSSTRFNLAPGGEARYVQGAWASGDYFTTLGVRAVLGRTFTTADDRRGCAGMAVLGYDFWQREFGGNKNVLEKTVSVEGHPFQVLGVVQPGFTGVEVGRTLDVVVPICAEPIVRETSALDRRSWWWLRIIGRPKAGVSPQQVAARMQTLAPQVFEATVPQNWRADGQAEYRKRTLDVTPAANGLSYLRVQYRQALIALMVVVGLVLVIACANVANLLLARASGRQKEIAIRMALGSGRGRLVRQLLTESVVLALAGAALGVAFAQWGSRLLVTFISTSDSPVYLDLTPDLRVLAFTIGVALLTGLLFGLAPAWRGTRVQPQIAMKENARGLVEGRSRFSAGKLLVMAQVALSLVLLTAAGLLLGSFRKLATMSTGFETENVLIANVDLTNAKYPKERVLPAFLEMLERLRALPGVRSASASALTPMSGSSWNEELKIDGFTPKSPDDGVAWFNRVTPEYFATLRTPLLAGRDFSSRDLEGAPRVAIVNQTMAKHFFGAANPVGRIFRTEDVKAGPPTEIVGMVADTKYNSMRKDFEPVVYVPVSQADPLSAQNIHMSFTIRGAAATDLAGGAREAITAVNRAVSIEFRVFSTQVAESLNRDRLLATLSGFFGGLGLLLATIGLYGVMSYNVARRRGEIGIRMALGAGAPRVLGMVLGEVTLLVAIGLAVGFAAAVASTRVLESQKFLYGLTARDPWTLGIAVIVLAAVALFAGYLP